MTTVRTAHTMLVAALVSGFGLAAMAAPVDQAAQEEPVVLAQMQSPIAARESAVALDEPVFPDYQAGVRRAAAQGNEALRRYILRTRMIYNFYFNDFAKKQ